MKTILVDAVDCFVVPDHASFKIFEGMHKLLEQYPNRKIILTNANDEQLKKYRLDKMPYEVFTLKHNPDKVDPTYFAQMLRHFNLTAKDVLYFEHKLDAIQSAQSVGIVSYHYDSAQKNLAALKQFIDENI